MDCMTIVNSIQTKHVPGMCFSTAVMKALRSVTYSTLPGTHYHHSPWDWFARVGSAVGMALGLAPLEDSTLQKTCTSYVKIPGTYV